MKSKRALKVFLGMFLTASPLFADINDDVFSGDNTSAYDSSKEILDEENGPLFLRTSFDALGKAKFSNNDIRGERLLFNEIDIDGDLIIHYNPCRKEGLLLSAGYSRYTLDWNHNPYFNEDHFNVVSIGGGFFSHRLEDWEWKGLVKMNFNASHLDFQHYVNWDLLLWGRYDVLEDWGLHLGFYMITGMKIDRIFPVIGLDWKPNDKWEINAIFPMNFSVIYKLDCDWTFALASRFWDVRQRAGEDEPLKRALWEYRNLGLELSTGYKSGRWGFNAHVGYALGGRLKISDSHNRHSHRLNFDGSPYVGGELSYNF